MFGGAVSRDLLFVVTNTGEATVTDPIVRVSVGRSTDLEPEIVDAEVGVLEPGAETVVTVPLELPMAAFGTYQVVGQVGDSETGAFTLEWMTYPWGLIALNVLGLVLIVWGVRRRRTRRHPAPYRPVIAATGDDSVVDLAAATAWWAYRAGVPRPIALRRWSRCRWTPSSTSKLPRSGGRAALRRILHRLRRYRILSRSCGAGHVEDTEVSRS